MIAKLDTDREFPSGKITGLPSCLSHGKPPKLNQASAQHQPCQAHDGRAQSDVFEG